MPTISTLSVELIREICHHMRDGDDQVDSKRDWALEQIALTSLCRTCKALDQIARPVLYKRIEISLKKATLMSLIRTLASRGDLSRGVQYLKLKSDDDPYYKSMLSNTDIATCTGVFQRWWPEGVDHLACYYALCARSKLADVLYILVPNAETMHICPALSRSRRQQQREVTPSGIFSQICQLRKALHEPSLAPPLGRLTLLDVGCNENSDWYDGWNYKSIFPLPPVSLVSLTIRRFSWSGGTECTHVNLRDIALYNCFVDSNGMDQLMTTCRGLRKFAYTAAVGHGVALKKCVTALKDHAHTLTDLYLLVPGGVPPGAFDDSFHSFTSLRTLSVHPLDIIGNGWDPKQTDMKKVIDRLPQSLEVFRLIEWSPVVSQDLVRLGEMASTGDLPNLRLLEVRRHHTSASLSVEVNHIKDALVDFEAGKFMLPLRISVCDGDGRDPSSESTLQVLCL
ncbi:hypothetical protein LZ30DRAFT_58511 [Colletotrichum cereale]|nr:hypothetical protein LZ30DRAFT_58511 [Colletotrichum cereale]